MGGGWWVVGGGGVDGVSLWEHLSQTREARAWGLLLLRRLGGFPYDAPQFHKLRLPTVLLEMAAESEA